MISLLSRCGNLIQNPSFESGLAFWQADNVITTNHDSAEGTQLARMGPGVASLYQDVAMGPWQRKPLFLSFIVYGDEESAGDLVTEVLWLDTDGVVIGTGLRAFLPGTGISDIRNTFFAVTDRPPLNAVSARLLFSKREFDMDLLLDLINLAPVETPNLVDNPSFESGLEEWEATNFNVVFTPTWEGGAAVEQSALTGTLSQEILLNPLQPGAAYLLSFSARSIVDSTITAQLIWLNALGNPIGAPGINATISPATLSGQSRYLNFVQLSTPAPFGAVRARLLFTASGAVGSTLDLDQVILVRLDSPNLIQNSEFDSGLDDWRSLGVTVKGTGGYVGLYFAELLSAGALINQTVTLPFGSACHCFLLNFALHCNNTSSNGNLFAQVLWLDALGNEIGLGLALVISQTTLQQNQWKVYTGFTERVPPGAVSAKIQFTKSVGGAGTELGLDSVIFARVD